MRDHDTPTRILRVLGSLNGLGKSTNLVNLEKKGIASILLDGSSNALRVSDSQVITNKLEIRGGAKVSPVSPVILIKGIFNRNNCREK